MLSPTAVICCWFQTYPAKGCKNENNEGHESRKNMRGQKGGIITRVDPPAADVMLVELELIREDVRVVVPEVVVVLGRAEDPLFVGGWGVVRVRDLGDRVRFDWEPCDTTAQPKIALLARSVTPASTPTRGPVLNRGPHGWSFRTLGLMLAKKQSPPAE